MKIKHESIHRVVSAFWERRAAGLTLQKLKKLMTQHGIPGKFSGSGSRWEVEVPDEKAKNKLFRVLPKDAGIGGYKTGYGAWVLRPGYQSMGDWNDPSSRWHYGSKLAAMNSSVFGHDRPSDIEFFFDPFASTVEVGMGGEWWGGKVKMGENVFHHRKERVDEAYRPVTVRVEKVGHHLRFAVMGGFGGGATFMLGFKGMF